MWNLLTRFRVPRVLERNRSLTIAEMTRTTLTGSLHPDAGVPLFSRR